MSRAPGPTEPGHPRATASKACSGDVEARLALYGCFDQETMAARLALRCISAVLPGLWPNLGACFFSPGKPRAPQDGGVRVQPLGELSLEELQTHATGFEYSVRVPPFGAGSPASLPEGWRSFLASDGVQELGSSSPPALETTSSSPGASEKRRVPALMLDGPAWADAALELLSPVLLERRRALLRLLGWYPDEPVWVVEARRKTSPLPELQGKLRAAGEMARGVSVCLVDLGGAGTHPSEEEVLSAGISRVVSLHPDASVEDVVAVLRGAELVLAEDPVAIALALATPPRPEGVSVWGEPGCRAPGNSTLARELISRLAGAPSRTGPAEGELLRSAFQRQAMQVSRQRHVLERVSNDALSHLEAERGESQRLREENDRLVSEMAEIRTTRLFRYSAAPRSLYSLLRRLAGRAG